MDTERVVYGPCTVALAPMVEVPRRDEPYSIDPHPIPVDARNRGAPSDGAELSIPTRPSPICSPQSHAALCDRTRSRQRRCGPIDDIDDIRVQTRLPSTLSILL